MQFGRQKLLNLFSGYPKLVQCHPLIFLVSKGKETIPHAAFLFSDSEWSYVFRNHASVGVLMGAGPSCMELGLQHGRSCCSSALNPSFHHWLCKIGWRGLDQAAFLWQGCWTTWLPSVQPKVLLLEQKSVILDIVSVSRCLDFRWLFVVKLSSCAWPMLLCGWLLAVRLRWENRQGCFWDAAENLPSC